MENKLPITVAENVYLGSTEEKTGMPLSDVLEGVVVAVEEVITDYDPNTLQPTLAIGTVTTVDPTTPASVVNSGTDHDVILDFNLPKGATGTPGAKGDTGDAATITVGTVTTGNPTDPAAVVNVGTTDAAILDFTIPKGVTGKSAYEIWLDDGHVGTETDFLQWLKASNSYTHIQEASSYTWAINHNLGKYPSVFVVDTGGNWVIGDVQYLNENQIIVRFTYEFSGRAYLN